MATTLFPRLVARGFKMRKAPVVHRRAKVDAAPRNHRRAAPTVAASVPALLRAIRQALGGRSADGKDAGLTARELPQAGVWVTIKRSRGTASLRRPEIIVTDQRTKRVLYDGPLAESR